MTESPRPSQALEQALAEEFETTFTDTRGGIELTYITGEQVISRLNEVLGVWGWSFTVKEHGYNPAADEIWVLGQLTLTLHEEGVFGPQVTREQFGSQKLRHSRNTDTILDLGFDLKGATTDALKKCASLIGIGLYLSHKEPAPEQPRANVEPVRLTPDTARAATQTNGAAQAPGTLYCMECGDALQEIRFKDGTFWTPQLLASYGQRKHGRTLCMSCYRAANERAKAAATPPVANPAYEPEETF